MSIAVCFGGSAWYSRLKYLASAPAALPSQEVLTRVGAVRGGAAAGALYAAALRQGRCAQTSQEVLTRVGAVGGLITAVSDHGCERSRL
jgi:hypothetical protein